ncbi:MAG: prolipoprotein diacylglyceryl transferase [Bacillus subtilis]|nr:prolipoprotein diacylglyceryl transferase [Bacillus subtilis]
MFYFVFDHGSESCWRCIFGLKEAQAHRSRQGRPDRRLPLDRARSPFSARACGTSPSNSESFVYGGVLVHRSCDIARLFERAPAISAVRRPLRTRDPRRVLSPASVLRDLLHEINASSASGRSFDLVAVGFIFAQTFGRWGNFMNQEAHGGVVWRQSRTASPT